MNPSLLLLAALAAGASPDAFDPAALGAHIAALAGDRMEGRYPGTTGHALAEDYVVDAFARAGLAPAGAGGSWRQPVPLRKATPVPGSGRVSLAAGGRTQAFPAGEASVMADRLRTRSAVTAPVVYAGWGIDAPDAGIESYAGLDVRGAVVAMRVGAPARLPSDLRAVLADADAKLAEAARRGAVGVLLLWAPGTEWFPYDEAVAYYRRGRHAWMDGDRPSGVPPGLEAVAAVSPAGTRRLFRAAARRLPGPGDPGPSFPMGITASLETASTHETLLSHNVAGLLRGGDPALRDEVVVVLAHLDHLGIGRAVDGDRIYNGALDNASGVAILIELARALAASPPRRSVLFLAVTAEEMGLLGSDLFAERPTVPREAIVAAVNLDMVLMLEPLARVVSYGAEHSSLGEVVRRAAGEEGFQVVPDSHPEEAIYVRSDHWSLAQRGIPGVFLDVGESPRVRRWLRRSYHRPSDGPEQPMDLATGAAFARLHARIVRAIADADARPAWTPGGPFERMFGDPAR